jgi:hypothetical protein
MLSLYNVNKLQFWEVKIVFHMGCNTQTLPGEHKCRVPALQWSLSGDQPCESGVNI